jgi:hypothetical protein
MVDLHFREESSRYLLFLWKKSKREVEINRAMKNVCGLVTALSGSPKKE